MNFATSEISNIHTVEEILTNVTSGYGSYTAHMALAQCFPFEEDHMRGRSGR